MRTFARHAVVATKMIEIAGNGFNVSSAKIGYI
jgi:hypothetical protein